MFKNMERLCMSCSSLDPKLGVCKKFGTTPQVARFVPNMCGSKALFYTPKEKNNVVLLPKKEKSEN